MNFLDFLHQHLQSINPSVNQAQQPTVPAPQESATPSDPNGIVVTAPQGRPEAAPPNYNDAPPRPAIDPKYILNDDRIMPTQKELDAQLPHKGMFGIHGTLRDVLGVLGDALSGKQIYANTRDQEKQGDAMFGFTQNPAQAIERLAAAGYTKQAEDLYKDNSQNEYQKSALASLDANRQAEQAKRKADTLKDLRNYSARMIHAAGEDPNKVTAALGLVSKLANSQGFTLDDLGVDPNMSDTERSVYGAGDMTVNQQEQLPISQQRADASTTSAQAASTNAQSGQVRAKAAMISATRSRPGPQPRAETELEYFRSIDAKPDAQRTAGERAFYKRYTTGKGSGSALLDALNGTSTPATTAAPANTQGWKVKRN